MLAAIVEFVWLLVLALFFSTVFFIIVIPAWILLHIMNSLIGTLRWITGNDWN
tara:strand:- start:827 stop:985 length:159 start_codon:yes stop_codon:yes gene_type:complete